MSESRPDNVNFISDEELAAVRPVVLSVVGPTNEGKTSVLRTLTGDAKFGEVNALTGTTVRAEIQKVFYKGKAEILRLIDTPGFQMSGEILDRLESDSRVDANDYSLDEILAAIPKDDVNFRHDRRAWDEVAGADLVVFTVNVAESPSAALHRDTLELLEHIHKPIIALFNNVAAGEKLSGANSAERFDADWTGALQKRGIHLIQIYDAHRRRFRDEYELFEKIAVFVTEPKRQKAIRAEMRERLRRESERLDLSRRAIAEMLLDVADRQLVEKNVSPEETKVRQELLRNRLRDEIAAREHAAHLSLLSIWNFSLGALDRKMMTIDGDVQTDDQGKLRKRSGCGAAIGAGIGLLLDVASAGLSLGTGTAIGAAIGGAIGGASGLYYDFTYDRKEKKITVQPQKAIFPPLLSRSVELVRRLSERGKAMEDNLQVLLASEPPKINAPEFFQLLKEYGFRPNRKIDGLRHYFSVEQPEDRRQRIARLAAALHGVLPDPDVIL